MNILFLILCVITPFIFLVIKPIRQYDYKNKLLVAIYFYSFVLLFTLVNFLIQRFSIDNLPSLIVFGICAVSLVAFALLKKYDKSKIEMPYWLFVVVHLFAICCFIASFVNILVFSLVSSLVIGMSIGEPLFFLGLTVLIIFNFEYNAQEQNEKDVVTIKAMPSKIKIDIKNKTFSYKSIKINLDEIVSYEVYNNDEVIIKSGLTEAITGGLLFGNAGVIAGAYAGKREVVKKSVKLFIETKNVHYAGITVKLSLDSAYKFDKTYKLLMQPTKQEEVAE